MRNHCRSTRFSRHVSRHACTSYIIGRIQAVFLLGLCWMARSQSKSNLLIDAPPEMNSGAYEAVGTSTTMEISRWARSA
jgi:hypothetical protein